uniref:hypothetical protein n=1 Tax=Escherichia coli TaxID=562 RepID=UPI001954E85E
LAKRSPGTRTWWRSHYHRKCSCIGCSDQETDLLAIFEPTAGGRFALHIEVKHPADGFESNGRQAEAYAARAECWSTPGKTPDRVLP